MIQLTKDMFKPLGNVIITRFLEHAAILERDGTCGDMSCFNCLFDQAYVMPGFGLNCIAISDRFGEDKEAKKAYRKEIARQYIKLFSEPDTIKLDLTE